MPETVSSDSDDDVDFDSVKLKPEVSSDDDINFGKVSLPRAPVMRQMSLGALRGTPSSSPPRLRPPSSEPNSRPGGPNSSDLQLSSQIQLEEPTHHALVDDALPTFEYPVFGSVRDYQRNISRKALVKNVLCILPTGTGKTFIAGVVMMNWYRWTKSAKVVFVAHTRPLVTQQAKNILEITGLPIEDTCLFAETVVKRNQRQEQWDTKRVFFATPQTVVNDIRAGLVDPSTFVCLVVDEAHRATGNFSYVELVKLVSQDNSSFRVLALTATPAASYEGVQEVVSNLRISHAEVRTEHSWDMREYVHSRRIHNVVTKYSDEQLELMSKAGRAFAPMMEILAKHGIAQDQDISRLSFYVLLQNMKRFFASGAGRTGEGNRVRAVGTIMQSMAYALAMLQTHGIYPFYERVRAFYEDKKGNGHYRKKLVESTEFQQLFDRSKELIFDGAQRRRNFIGHPKLRELIDIVTAFFLERGAHSRGIIFAEFRESAAEVLWILQMHCAEFARASLFVGQSSKDDGSVKGMNQKEQQNLLTNFRSGEFNLLIATCIGEEGLDIGEVDLIICYDQSSSPIRSIQRIGRTGRKRDGTVYMLMTEKEKRKLDGAMQEYRNICDLIVKNSFGGVPLKFSPSPRIIPGEFTPQYKQVTVEHSARNLEAFEGDFMSAFKIKAAKKPPRKRAKLDKEAVQYPGFQSVAEL